MGWWSWLFQAISGPAVTTVDQIWLTEEAMLKGLVKEIDDRRQAGWQILLLGHFSEDLGGGVLSLQAEKIPFRVWQPPRNIEATVRELQSAERTVLMAKVDSLPPVAGDGDTFRPERPQLRAMIFVVNHHPEIAVDERILHFAMALPIELVVFCSSLDHPLFRRFAGANLQTLLRTLGMQEDEAIESPIIHRQVARAQRRIAQRVTESQPAESAEEWFEVNLPHGV